MTRNLIHCEFFLLRYDEKKASNLVDCLMDIYTSHLLPTFNIVHSQYIIFYLANIDPGGVSNFHQKIFKLNASRLSPAVLNCYLENFFFSELSLNHKTGGLCWDEEQYYLYHVQTAMSYLASFLSRSAVITPQQVGQDFNLGSKG